MDYRLSSGLLLALSCFVRLEKLGNDIENGSFVACVAGVPFRAQERSVGGLGREGEVDFSRARKGTPATRARVLWQKWQVQKLLHKTDW